MRERTLLIEKALADGETKPTKTGQLRAVRLLKPLNDDLQLWRLMSAGSDDELVFPTATGGPLRDYDWRNGGTASTSPSPRRSDSSAHARTTSGTRS